MQLRLRRSGAGYSHSRSPAEDACDAVGRRSGGPARESADDRSGAGNGDGPAPGAAAGVDAAADAAADAVHL